MDRTDITIRRFLSALPATGYDLGILSERGMYRLESASYSRIKRMLPYLKHRNANGAHIYIRPTGESSYTLLDDLTQSTVADLILGHRRDRSLHAAHFRRGGADRYSLLIRQALRDDRDGPGAKARPEALDPAFRSDHLSSSREHVSGQPVKAPRHNIVCRRRSRVIEVLRVLHDSRDLARHLPAEYQAGD